MIGSQSLLSALQGSLVVQCKINGTTDLLNGQLFGEQVAASLLNAAAFSPNNYSESLGQVQLLVRQIWSTTPNNKTQAQHSLDSVTNTLSALNINT